MSSKPRLEYEATDVAVDAILSEGLSALHILTVDQADLTVLLKTDLLRKLHSQISYLLKREAETSEQL